MSITAVSLSSATFAGTALKDHMAEDRKTIPESVVLQSVLTSQKSMFIDEEHETQDGDIAKVQADFRDHLEYSRMVIQQVFKEDNGSLTAEKRAQMQWDLWVVTGILDFGFPINELLREREKYERCGRLPETYDLLASHI